MKENSTDNNKTRDPAQNDGPGKLNLSVPPFRQGSKKKKLGDTIPVKRWHELQKKHESLLNEVAAFLRPTNREKADTLDRIYLAETSLQTISHGINKIYNAYLSQEDFPESEIQRDALNSAIDAIHQVITAYKHIFKAEYESFNSPMKLVHDRVRHAGFRILELTQIEQRLLAAAHQKLPDTAWKDLNQVFFVFWHFNDYTTPRELSGCLKINKTDSKVVFTGNQPKSPVQLYVSTQLFALADGSNIPNKALHIIDAYLSMINEKISVSAYSGDELVDGMLIIPKDLAQPPQIKLQNIKKPALLIDLFDLWRQIKKDADSLEKINRGIKEDISPALATLSPVERRPLIEGLLNKLRHYSRKSTRNNPSTSVPLNIFIGFSESHQAIAKFSNQEKQDDHTLGLLKELSRNSSGISIDNKHSIDESWYLADISEGGLRVQTQVSRFTTKISVGNLIAYNIQDKNDFSISLGYITRINRLNEIDMELSIVKLCENPQAVVVHDKKRQGKDSAMIGFVINPEKNSRQLVLPNSWHAAQKQELNLVFQGLSQGIMTQRLALQQRDFTVFDFTQTD